MCLISKIITLGRRACDLICTALSSRIQEAILIVGPVGLPVPGGGAGPAGRAGQRPRRQASPRQRQVQCHQLKMAGVFWYLL